MNYEIKNQIKAALEITTAIGGAIRELKSVPAGHLYAQTASKLTLEQFDGAVGLLVKSGCVRRDPSGMLTWIGGN